MRELLDELHANPDHPGFVEIQAAVDDQIDHFAFLELEMAVKLNDSAAIVAPRRPVALPVPEQEGYQPSFTPGSHIPHFWIAPELSSLDVLSFDRMTLFVPAQEVAAWEGAVTAMPPGLMAVNVVPIDGEMRSVKACVEDYWGGVPYAVLVRPDVLLVLERSATLLIPALMRHATRKS